MDRLTIQTGSFEVNTSIVYEGGEAWLFDPGSEGERLARLLAEKGLVPKAVVLTHAHFDHTGAIGFLQSAYPELPVYMHPADVQMIDHPFNRMPPDYPGISKPKLLKDCRELGFCRVIETPGHTPGGVCYYFENEKLLISGDTLFAGSIGRTDLPLGDTATLMRSLEKLKTLPDDTLVIPGHGRHTSIKAEKAENPYFFVRR